MENKCSQRSRNVICSSNIRTNVSLVRKHFPKSSPLSTIFNSKELKVSYKTNMCSMINSLSWRCIWVSNERKLSMIYNAEVKTASENKHYYGQTFRKFKKRFYGHQSDLRNQAKADSTTLSKFVQNERGKGEEPEIR